MVLSMFLISVLIPFKSSLSESTVIYGEYEYAMGDNDTKKDARRICLLEAQRRCLENAGTYLMSRIEIENHQLTKDELIAYTGGLVKSEIVNEEVKFSGPNMAIYIKVKSDINLSDLQSKMAEVRNNDSLSLKFISLQRDYDQLADKIRRLQDQLESVDSWESEKKVRTERAQVLGSLSKLENIRTEIEQKARVAIDNIELGMTREEVISLIGKPRVQSKNGHLNYGKVWVMIESGVVSCIIDAKCFRYYCDCIWYRTLERECIVK
ncbi:MAG: hypothetical protein CO189_04905 [candidate division Zixibacteria bacterium CG_4_9_14_3_um_filter_46_8]|nr:MAG: hypothetical protein CO189_04905 [candidate division Zixibacteria bacterium CG_4_9_14_3_um_filter_46_8]